MVSEKTDSELGGFDVVHAFAAPRQQLRRARAAGAAVVISPIWVSADYRYAQADSTAGRLRGATRGARVAHSTFQRGIDETAKRLREATFQKALLFELADLLLPNSLLEAEQIRSDLGVSTPMHVVPNGFDARIFTPPSAGRERLGVAFVGRIEPHKNQLGLIRELRGTGIPLTIAGPDHPDHSAYCAQCRREADESVTFLPGGDEQAVRDVYQSARVHALPSWFETTGLSSLEAAGTGCAIVTTSRGYAREYFGEHALYCDPGRKGSIRDAIRTALAQGPSEALRPLILEKFTWTRAAEATLAGYARALASRTAGVMTSNGPR